MPSVLFFPRTFNPAETFSALPLLKETAERGDQKTGKRETRFFEDQTNTGSKPVGEMQGYEVGTRLRYRLTLASGMLECLCFAGVVFGFASLVFVLKEDGYFSQLCVSIPGTNLTSAGEKQFKLHE